MSRAPPEEIVAEDCGDCGGLLDPNWHIFNVVVNDNTQLKMEKCKGQTI